MRDPPAPGAAPPPRPPRVHKLVNVPREAVGFVIGRHGETVRDMCARSRASIAVDERHRDPHAAHAVFNVNGTPDQVEAACALLQEKVNAVLHARHTHTTRDPVLSPTTPPPPDPAPADDGPTQPASSADRASSATTPAPLQQASVQPHPLEMWIPQGRVGMVIGHYGQTISNIQSRSGATIVVHNECQAQDGSKLLTISGQPPERKVAFDMVTNILDRDNGRGRSSRGPEGPSAHRRERMVPNQHAVPSPTSAPHEPLTELTSPGAPGPQGQQPMFAGPQFATRVPFDHMMFPTPQRGSFFQPPVHAVKAVRVPTSCVGIVIGKSGETIRDLQQRSGAYIKVTPDREAGEGDQERLIYISGPPASIELAHNLLNDIVNEGLNRGYRDGATPFGNDAGEPFEGATERDPSRAGPSRSGPVGGDVDALHSRQDETVIVPQPMTGYPSNSISLLMQVPNAKVGVIIGKRGQTIRDLQQLSGARIVISKKMDTSKPHNPRDVKITGPRTFAERARALILDKIHGGGSGGSSGVSPLASPVARADDSAGLPPSGGQFAPRGYPAAFPQPPFLAVPSVEGFPEPAMEAMRGSFGPPSGYALHAMQTQALHQQAIVQQQAQAQAMQQAYGPPPYQMFPPASPAFPGGYAPAPAPAGDPEQGMIRASVLAYAAQEQREEITELAEDTAALRLTSSTPVAAPESAEGDAADEGDTGATEPAAGAAGGHVAEAQSPSNGASRDVEGSSGE